MTSNNCPSCNVEVDPGTKFCHNCGTAIATHASPVGDLSLFEYFVKCLKNYVNFSGRAHRKEFWGYMLFRSMFLVSIFISHKIIFDTRESMFLTIVFVSVIFLLFLLTLDREKPCFGKKWWAWLLSMVPFSALLYGCIYSSILDRGLSRDVYFDSYLTIHTWVFMLFFLLPDFAVIVRRFHDIGKGGENCFLFAIPAICSFISRAAYKNDNEELGFFFLLCTIIGIIWLFVLLSKEGQGEKNEYGLNPKAIYE